MCCLHSTWNNDAFFNFSYIVCSFQYSFGRNILYYTEIVLVRYSVQAHFKDVVVERQQQKVYCSFNHGALLNIKKKIKAMMLPPKLQRKIDSTIKFSYKGLTLPLQSIYEPFYCCKWIFYQFKNEALKKICTLNNAALLTVYFNFNLQYGKLTNYLRF